MAQVCQMMGWEGGLLKPLQNDMKCFYAHKGHQTLPSILSAEISGQRESLFQQGLLIIYILLQFSSLWGALNTLDPCLNIISYSQSVIILQQRKNFKDAYQPM